ncbi:3-oxo-Delta(45)-steroid 5-beta-reductase protein [Rutstroemia sp. NJR-2017a BBW]|nr:3-oxo-Delta(45)-steroid 5-beta-reductase protein [Rutstroemia sp. NJR-2017a BBW]
MSPRQALIFGASGISGWAIVREALQHKGPTDRNSKSKPTFDRVIALSRSPLNESEFLITKDITIKRLVLHSGIDLGQAEDADILFKNIEGIEKTTHVYYAAYGGHGTNLSTLKKINTTFFRTALSLITTHCPNLEFLTLQTGAKTYGFEFFGQPGMSEYYRPPHVETAPRLPAPYADSIFYYEQIDDLIRTQRSLLETDANGNARGELNAKEKGKPKWKWAEIRPDLIIGHTPRSNGMGFAQALGVFLSMYAFVEAKGKEVKFPGAEEVWKGRRTDSSQDLVGRFSVWVSLQGDESVNGKAYNVVDSGCEGTTWEEDWPRLCEYFGLKGVGPASEENDIDPTSASPTSVSGSESESDAGTQMGGGELTGVDWVMAHEGRWGEWLAQRGVKDLGQVKGSSWDMLVGVLKYLKMDRRLDGSEMSRIGFNINGEVDAKGDGDIVAERYFKAWDRMRKSGIIA